MDSLVNARVTPQCAARVGPYARRATFAMIVPFGILLYFILVMGMQARTLGDVQYDFAMVCACLSLPSAWLQLSGWLVYLQVPSAIGCDLIQQSTRNVQNMARGSSCSWNQVMAYLQSAHETSLCLSALLSPVIIANMLISGGMIALWLGTGLAPRTKLPEDSWLVVWVPQWVLYFAMLCFYVNAILPLFVGARCSRACDELVEAIASLRATAAAGESSCAGERRSQGIRYASAYDLVQLNGILQYGCELNRSQGVGFTLLSRRMCVCIRLSRCCLVDHRPSVVLVVLTETLLLALGRLWSF